MDNLFNIESFMSFFGILAAIAAIGVLVAVHEAGHLLMAKMCNIRVTIFSVGMGHALWSKQWGETTYQIGWIPFGGYCAFGEENEAEKADPRSILNAPYWAKFLTIIGGSLFNLIFAFVVLFFIFGFGYKEPRLSNVVRVAPTVNNAPSPAWEAGLRSGDRIIAVGQKPVNHFFDIPVILASEKIGQTTVTYVREETTNSVSFTPLLDENTGVPLLGVNPVQPTQIVEILEDSPASRAGLRINDTIQSIEGYPVAYAFQALDIISNSTKEIRLQVLRGEDLLDFNATPMQVEGMTRIGVIFDQPQAENFLVRAENLPQNFALAFQELSKLVDQMTSSIQKIFSGQINLRKNLSGPVRIVAITSEIAQTLNFVFFLRFAVMLSVALAVFNMLPIPGLDGGSLVLNGIRAIGQRSPFAAQTETIISFIERAGLILLLILAAFIFYNDVVNIRDDYTKQVQKTQQIP